MAKATTEQEKQIKDWFIKELWPRYGGKHITSTQKGSRGKAIQIMIKINPNEDEQKRMLANMVAQLRACDKDKGKGEFVARWPMCTTYLNDRRYDDEIESRMLDDTPRHILSNCSHDGCFVEIMGKNFTECQTHFRYEEGKQGVRDQLSKIGMSPTPGENKSEYALRCRAYYMKNLKGVL